MAKTKTWCEVALEAREEWNKENNYYKACENEGRCIRCIHFSINHNHITMGECSKLKQAFQEREFVKKGASDYVVSVMGVCENFTNIHGIGLDGKIVMPQLLPSYAKTRIDKKTGKMFIA